MKAAGSVDDAEAIMANVQKGLEGIPADKMIYQIEKVEDDGRLIHSTSNGCS